MQGRARLRRRGCLLLLVILRLLTVRIVLLLDRLLLVLLLRLLLLLLLVQLRLAIRSVVRIDLCLVRVVRVRVLLLPASGGLLWRGGLSWLVLLVLGLFLLPARLSVLHGLRLLQARKRVSSAFKGVSPRLSGSAHLCLPARRVDVLLLPLLVEARVRVLLRHTFRRLVVPLALVLLLPVRLVLIVLLLVALLAVALLVRVPLPVHAPLALRLLLPLRLRLLVLVLSVVLVLRVRVRLAVLVPRLLLLLVLVPLLLVVVLVRRLAIGPLRLGGRRSGVGQVRVGCAVVDEAWVVGNLVERGRAEAVVARARLGGLLVAALVLLVIPALLLLSVVVALLVVSSLLPLVRLLLVPVLGVLLVVLPVLGEPIPVLLLLLKRVPVHLG